MEMFTPSGVLVSYSKPILAILFLLLGNPNPNPKTCLGHVLYLVLYNMKPPPKGYEEALMIIIHLSNFVTDLPPNGVHFIDYSIRMPVLGFIPCTNPMQ